MQGNQIRIISIPFALDLHKGTFFHVLISRYELVDVSLVIEAIDVDKFHCTEHTKVFHQTPARTKITWLSNKYIDSYKVSDMFRYAECT